MIAIAVDDEPLMLGALCKAVSASPDIALLKSFSDCEQALEWVRDNRTDIAFLDINMRGMGGLSLAERIMTLRPACRVIFCTGYEEYAIPAFRLHASGYLMKPIDAEDVQREIDNVKCVRATQKLLQAKCFGTFEVSAAGAKLAFKRSKSKEMLAFLIDRNGAGVSAMEICIALWGEEAEEKCHGYFHQLLRDLRQTLESVGAESLLKKTNNRYSVDADRIECDYYSYLRTGKPEFRGEYMLQYGWAEETCGFLWAKE